MRIRLLWFSLTLMLSGAALEARSYVVTDWSNAMDIRYGSIVNTVYVVNGTYDGDGLARAMRIALQTVCSSPFSTYNYPGHEGAFSISCAHGLGAPPYDSLLSHTGQHRRTGIWPLISFSEDIDHTAPDGQGIAFFSDLGVLPFGSLDTPAPNQIVSGTIAVQGWALSQIPGAIPTDGSTVAVYVDGVQRGAVIYNIDRTDVAAAYPGYANSIGAGFYLAFDTRALVNGVHTISFNAYDDLGRGAGIGSRYFTTAN